MQKPHLPVRAGKLPRLMGGGIGPRTEACVNLGGPIAIEPCLHQGNVYIKRKLRVWRAQKCIPLVGAEIPPTCAGHQTTLSHGVGIGPTTETYVNWGGRIAMVSCLHQDNVYIKRQLRVWRNQKCIPLVGAETSLTCVGWQTTWSHGGRCRSQKKNLRKLEWTYLLDLSPWYRVCTKAMSISKQGTDMDVASF